MLRTILLMMVCHLETCLAMLSGAQNENQQQASDPIFKLVALQEVKALSSTNNRWNSTLNLSYHHRSVDWKVAANHSVGMKVEHYVNPKE